jgi:starvation-inducible DNA-binding protein
MYETRNDLNKNVREKIIGVLNVRLADAIDLYAQTKHAHWNVKGPNFIALHKLFDDIAGDVTAYVDDLAERVVQLGGVAEGMIKTIAQRSTLPAFPPGGVWETHVNAIAGALAHFGKNVRADIAHTDELGDADTADLLTEVSRGVDKWVWFVEAHVQKESGR